MTRRRYALLLFPTFLVTASAAQAQATKAAEPPKAFDLAAIDAYIAGQVREKGYPGLSLTIVRDGKVVLAKGYGKRSRAEDKPVEPETMFAIGSVTKQFTCACVLLLAEEGKLSVDDKVAKYYPDLTKAGEITLYDLMSHASGYPDYYPLDFVDRRLAKSAQIDDVLKEYAGGKLDFEPGTRWSYSNTGFLLLGRVVEKVSGEPFGAFLERRILKPLGMRHSAFASGEPGAEGRARGYTSFALGEPELAVPEAEGWIHAAGGLWASGPDLARWDLALIGAEVLKPASLRLMTTARTLADGRATDYGCGLGVYQREGERVLMHTGGVSGFLSFNAMIPRTKSAVILLANSDHLDPAALHRTVLGLLLRADHTPLSAQAIPKINGPSPKEAGLDFLHQMQAGELDREKLGEEFSVYLTDERLKAASPRLKALGEPESVEVQGVVERGGMEVASLRIAFKDVVLKGLLYRSPDGKIQQLLFKKE